LKTPLAIVFRMDLLNIDFIVDQYKCAEGNLL